MLYSLSTAFWDTIMTAHMHVAHSRDRMMFLSAAVFSFLVAVQATLSKLHTNYVSYMRHKHK